MRPVAKVLRVRYDGRDRGVQLQATILATAAPDLVQIEERAAAVARSAGQPMRGRPGRDVEQRLANVQLQPVADQVPAIACLVPCTAQPAAREGDRGGARRARAL